MAHVKEVKVISILYHLLHTCRDQLSLKSFGLKQVKIGQLDKSFEIDMLDIIFSLYMLEYVVYIEEVRAKPFNDLRVEIHPIESNNQIIDMSEMSNLAKLSKVWVVLHHSLEYPLY